MRKAGLLTALALLLGPLATELHAQDGYLLGRPQGQLTLRAGPVLHRADSDIFDFFRSELTLDRGDFRAPAVAGELGLYLHRRVDLVLGGGWSETESQSEFRDFVEEAPDGSDMPIQQVTSLRVVPVTASVRFYPLSRGQSISELAWVPARAVPYLGAGGGVAWYRLQQSGDFVADDLSIFTASFTSSGRAAIGHAFAGLDYWFAPRVGLNVEGRYTVGSAEPKADFATWDSIDLNGAQLGVGLTLRW